MTMPPLNTRTGGQILIDQLVAQGVERVFCVPGESYLAALDALHDSAIDVMICRAGGRRRDDGGGLGQADRPARHLLRHPRPRRHQRQPRRAYRRAGFDADDPVHRPGRRAACASARRSRRSTTRPCSARWRNGSSRSTTPTAFPELVARAFRVAMQGRPGPVVIALPEDMLTEMAAVADAPRVEPAETWPGHADMSRSATCCARPKRPFVILGGSGWTERRRERSRASPSASTCRSRPRSAAPCCFRPIIRNYAGDLGIGPSPS